MNEIVLQELGLILVAATTGVLLARLARIPSIVAYLLSGLVLGPGLGLVPVSDSVELVSEAGIILLLFVVGLELSFSKIREVASVALAVGALQVGLTGLAISMLLWVFRLPPMQIVVLAVAFTFSSTVVVVKLLDQLAQLDARHGRIAVGILLIQDLAVLVVLTFVGGLSAESGVAPAEVLGGLARAFLGMGLLVGSATVASRFLLPSLLSRVSRSQETLLVGSLAWCFTVVLASEQLGLSLELGGFIAGVSLAQLSYSHDLRRRVHPLMSFFVAVFFVSLGIHMEFEAAARSWPLVSALVLFTLLMKPWLVDVLLRTRGEEPDVALRTGVALGQTSEFSFLLAALALSRGLIDEDMVSVVGTVGLLTMGLSPLLVVNGGPLVDWISTRRRRGRGQEVAGHVREVSATGGHVVVVGMNSLGRRIVQMLAARGIPTLAIDTDPGKLADLPCRTLAGNAEYLSVLREAGVMRARLLVSALRIEHVNRLLAYRAIGMNVPCVVHAYDQASEVELRNLGVTHLIDSRTAGIERLTEALLELGVFGK